MAQSSPSGKAGPIKNRYGTELTHKNGTNQATIKLPNKLTMGVWRRLFLIRYFAKLGDKDDIMVKWIDYDSQAREIAVNDEKKPFNWKVPVVSNIDKSIVSVLLKKKKLFVLTLYYTSRTILIQGQKTTPWVKSEYENLLEQVNDIIQTKGNPDLQIEEMPMNNQLFEIAERIEEFSEYVDQKHQEKESEQQKDKEKRGETKNVNEDKQNNNSQNENRNEIPNKVEQHTKEILDLKSTIHKIEQAQIKSETEMRKDIEEIKDSIQNNLKEVKQIKVELKQCKDQYTKIEATLAEKIENAKLQHFSNQVAENKEKLQEKLKVINKVETDIKSLNEKIVSKETIRKIEEKIQENDRKVEIIESEVVILKEQVNNHTKRDQSEERESERRENRGRESPKPDFEGERNAEEVDIWIIGTSLVKDLRGRKMYRNNNVKITTLQDKTVYGATQLIKLGKVEPKHLLFQVGSNELENKTPDDIMNEIDKLTEAANEYCPGATISFCEIIPRFYGNRSVAATFEENRNIFNNLLKDYCSELDYDIVIYDNFRCIDYYDGIHLNDIGQGIMVKCMKKVLDKKLGIEHRNIDNESGSWGNQRGRDSENTYQNREQDNVSGRRGLYYHRGQFSNRRNSRNRGYSTGYRGQGNHSQNGPQEWSPSNNQSKGYGYSHAYRNRGRPFNRGMQNSGSPYNMQNENRFMPLLHLMNQMSGNNYMM